MPKCRDCGTTYRNMDHSVYDCAQAGGKEAQRMMAPRATAAFQLVPHSSPIERTCYANRCNRPAALQLARDLPASENGERLGFRRTAWVCSTEHAARVIAEDLKGRWESVPDKPGCSSMRNMRGVASLPLGFHHGMLRRTRMACDEGFPLLYARRIARPLHYNELYRARILSTRVDKRSRKA